MTINLDEISKLLGEATPGPWAYGLLIHHDHEVVASVINCDGNCVANARLIAAAPTIIKELVEQSKAILARNEELQRRVDRLEKVAERSRAMVDLFIEKVESGAARSKKTYEDALAVREELLGLDAKEQDDETTD